MLDPTLMGETPSETSSPFASAVKSAVMALLSTAALGAAAAVGDYTAKVFQKKMRDFLAEKNLPPEPAVKIVGDQVVVGSAQVGAGGYSNASARPPVSGTTTSSYNNYRGAPSGYSQSDQLFGDWNR